MDHTEEISCELLIQTKCIHIPITVVGIGDLHTKKIWRNPVFKIKFDYNPNSQISPIYCLCESLIVKTYLKPIIGNDCKTQGFYGYKTDVDIC